jgi:hypothetical protein
VAARELASKVAGERRLFLFANSSWMGHEIRKGWRNRCKTNLPDDPAWLEEYALSTIFDFPPPSDESLRGRILEHARQIDAGNGFWDLREANACLDRSGFSYLLSKPRKGLGPAFPELTLDEPYEDAVSLLEKAAASPRFESYVTPRSARRLEMLGPASDLAELADRNMFAEDQQGRGIVFLRWRDLWEARAYELERAGDRDGLRRWFETLERLMWRCMKEWGDEQLQSVVILFMTEVRRSENLRNSLRNLKLYQEVARLDHWDRQFSGSLPVTASGAEDFSRMAAAPVSNDWYVYAEKGLVEMSELEPGRRAERAMADRMLAVTAAVLFGVLAWLAGLEGWRRAQPVGGLATGLAVLLRPADFVWVCGLGIALPAALHVAVDGFSPLGWRDYSITILDMKPIALRAAGSFLFATCMLVQSARWRLAKRGGLLGFRPVLWPGWLVAATAALFVPAMGAVRCLTKGQEEFMSFGSAAAGVPLLWLLWRAFAITLCPRAVALPGSMVCRMLVPSFMTASVVLLAAAFLLHREESKWVRRDTILHPDPGGSGMSVVEARWAKALREQLRHAMETAPKAK